MDILRPEKLVAKAYVPGGVDFAKAFQWMDTNNDGRLAWAEFLSGVRVVVKLSESEVNVLPGCWTAMVTVVSTRQIFKFSEARLPWTGSFAQGCRKCPSTHQGVEEAEEAKEATEVTKATTRSSRWGCGSRKCW